MHQMQGQMTRVSLWNEITIRILLSRYALTIYHDSVTAQKESHLMDIAARSRCPYSSEKIFLENYENRTNNMIKYAQRLRLFFFHGDVEFFKYLIRAFDGIRLIDAVASSIRWSLFEARSNRR